MVYMPTLIDTNDIECSAWLSIFPTVIDKILLKAYYNQISKLPLMISVEEKYWSGSLKLLMTFSKESHKNHQVEIDLILKDYSEGEVW